MLVPDNLKSGVNKACRYEPGLNHSYQQLAVHYAVTVMIARPYKPKDKAKVEIGVQIVTTIIMALYAFISNLNPRQPNSNKHSDREQQRLYTSIANGGNCRTRTKP